MTTAEGHRRVHVPSAPVQEPEAARSRRLDHRRRMIRWSLPVVTLALLLAVKLVGQGLAAGNAHNAYERSEQAGVRDNAALMAMPNIVERHKAPFAEGDAHVLAGEFDRARVSFEEALTLAPADSVESCQIRVNLVLSLEKLGDAVKAAGDQTSAKSFFDRVAQVVDGAPKGCFQPSAGSAGQQLNDARSRSQSKNNTDPQRNPQQNGQPPSEDKQRQLDEKTKQNQQDRSLTSRDKTAAPPDSSPPKPSAKPW